MSADLPEMGYRGGLDMARKLVTYLDDPVAIRRAIAAEFDQVPAERTIRGLRADHLAYLARPDNTPAKAHDGYYPAEASDLAARTSLVFLARLEAERAVSKASLDALGSYPDFADKRWNADILTARLDAETAPVPPAQSEAA